MYQITIDEEKWIVRFSRHLSLELDERDKIVAQILRFGNQLAKFAHGESFAMIDDGNSMAVCQVKKIPSFILTILAVIPKEYWFVKENSEIRRLIQDK
jgi:hypothetical protein